MQKKREKNKYGFVFFAMALLIVAVVVGTVFWSIHASRKNMDQTVNSLSSFYMEELVGKRAIVLRDMLNRDFEQLGRVASLIKEKGASDGTAMREILWDAQKLYGATKLALVDGEGTVYSATSIVSDASRYTFLQNNFTEPRVITSNLYGAKKQVVVAIPLEDLSLNGKKFVACFMQIDIDDVAGSLIYEAASSSQNTFIGLYYKNGENLTTTGLGDIEAGRNLLTYIRGADLSGAQSYDEIEQSFRRGEKGLVTIESEGDTRYIYYMPVEDTDWMLTVMVYDNTITDQLQHANKATLRINTILLSIVFTLIIIIFLIFLYLYRRNSEMQRRQRELELKAENEEALRLARDAAEKANRAKTEFLFNMSHDIRTPMNAVTGFAKIMEGELDRPDKLKVHLEKLQDASNYLLSIINNVLDMARIESGKSELKPEPIDLMDSSANVFNIFAADIRKKGLKILRSADITHRYVYADTQKLNQITANLIGNAVKYTPEGGSITVRMEELPCDEPGRATYMLTVSDTGIGMSEEFREHIFESFTRERTALVNNVVGTGLGMAIVKNLVEMHGGTITVESEPGKGTTFRVTLTLDLADSCEKEAPAQPAGETYEGRFKGKRILMAEDNDINAEIAMDILEETGISIDRAADGVICVDMLEKAEPGTYDLILMDIQMPNRNGYEAARIIRQLPDKEKAAIPIIAMTANAFEEDKKNALDAGMNGHLAKPIDIPKLMEALGGYLKE